MSIAGVRSSRGDGYQTMIAFKWVLQMLYDPMITGIEIDTTGLDPAGEPVAVDDIVIHFGDDHTVYCQCKKNQGDFESWKFPDLKEELVNAGGLLARDPKAIVHFYSRNNFGAVQKLHEHARAYADNVAFLQSLKHQGSKPKKKEKSDREETLELLDGIWHEHLSSTNSHVLDFLKRITFETTPDVEALRERELGTLRLHVTRAEAAFEAISTRIDSIGRRTTPVSEPMAIVLAQRMERADLLLLLATCGAQVTPPRQEAELQQAFQQASAVGRSWRRKIGSKQLPRAALGKLLIAIEAKPKTLVISDGPGFGKTCLLLDLVEHLDASPTHACLFIQAREFAKCKTEAERVANGFIPDVIGTVARMAEYRHTIVVIDSMDVLSLSQDHQALNYFLSLIDRLQHSGNVSVIAACRSFDLKYDSRLLERSWGQEMSVGPLEWHMDVLPLLQEWGVQEHELPDALKALLTNPRLLDLFGEIVRRGENTLAASAQELADHYLHTVVSRNAALGHAAMEHIERLSQLMLKKRQLDIPLARANLPENMCALLLSEGVLSKTTRGNITFGHQTLLDVLAVNAAEHAGDTLLDFISRQAATPFVRPSIRAFFFHLRRQDTNGFRAQFRAVLAANNVAFHIKRLLCESLAETIPEEADSGLIKNLFAQYLPLFDAFYWPARRTDWFDFLRRYWLPQVIAEKNSTWIVTYAESVTGSKNEQPVQTISFWLLALDFDWVDRNRLVYGISRELHGYSSWNTSGMRELFEKIVKSPKRDHDFIGDALCKWVETSNSGDDLLWNYIVSELPEQIDKYFPFQVSLCCDSTVFHDGAFLGRRMTESETLLDLAIGTINNWSEQLALHYPDGDSWRGDFNRERIDTDEGDGTHARPDSALEELLAAIEAACFFHAQYHTIWWQKMAHQLATSREGALRDIAIMAFIAQPKNNVPEITAFLMDKGLLTYHCGFELARLINLAAPMLAAPVMDGLQSNILVLFQEHEHGERENVIWVKKRRSDLIAAIPAHFRLPPAQRLLDDVRRQFTINEIQPDKHSGGCRVGAPIACQTLLQLSDTGLESLLKHYADQSDHAYEILPSGDWVGGAFEIAGELRDAASRDPDRFLHFMQASWNELTERFRLAIMDGVSLYLRYRFGNLTSSDTNWKVVAEPNRNVLVATILSEVEGNLLYWQSRREVASVLEGCAHAIEDSELIERLIVMLGRFVTTPSAYLNHEGGENLIFTAINSLRGISADAAMILANRYAEAGNLLPISLEKVLVQFASDPHPSVKAIILRRLLGIQRYLPIFSWRLFDLATHAATGLLWHQAEHCLKYSSYSDFELVSRYLARIEIGMDEDSAGVWGRVSALACLSGHISSSNLLTKLATIPFSNAWGGAALVFASNAYNPRCQDTCHQWLVNATMGGQFKDIVVGQFTALFKQNSPPPMIPSTLVARLFELRTEQDNSHRLYGFPKWLLARSEIFPDEALEAIEIMLRLTQGHGIDCYDDSYAKLLTRLFREGEELEMVDGGQFLTRTIVVQDALLACGIHRLNEWLQAAERK